VKDVELKAVELELEITKEELHAVTGRVTDLERLVARMAAGIARKVDHEAG